MSELVLIPEPKAPGENGVYVLDFSDRLDDDRIGAVAWALPSGVAQAGASFTDRTAELTVSGGVDGSDYLITCTVTTAVGGIPLQGFIMVRVRQPGSEPTAVSTRYATLANMMARFGEREMLELTDTAEPRVGQVNAAVAAQALADADATIDGYIGSRYTLPLQSVPELLVVIACDIARYRLMRERPIDSVTNRYKDAIAWLSAVAAGKFSLGLDGTGNLTEEGDEGPIVRAQRRVFTREHLRDYLRPPIGGMYY